MENVNENYSDKSHCMHFVLRKKRFCRMSVKEGFQYCGEHEPQKEKTNNDRSRIPCPYDNKHTCFASKLAKHLKKCNAKFNSSLPYLIKNINAGNLESDDGKQSNRLLANYFKEHVLEVIRKVKNIYTDILQNSITESILKHEQLSEELEKKEYGSTTRKHLLQTSSILGHLKQANLLNSNTCFVEFGAGKGKLSYWIANAVKDKQNNSVVLIEKASLRHKHDNKLDKSENQVCRLRADIADLVLSEVEIVKQFENVVGVSKHLCGNGTDFALRCLMNAKNKLNIQGILMTFCCHHRCFWPAYTGKKFFESNHLTKDDFDVICRLVSWATCGDGRSRTQKNTHSNYDDTPAERDERIDLTREEKEFIGKISKFVVDYGRLKYLEENNYDCNLYFYIQPSISLENVCIVAIKKNYKI